MSELPQIITKVWILQCDKLASLWKQYIWNDLSGIHIVDKGPIKATTVVLNIMTQQILFPEIKNVGMGYISPFAVEMLLGESVH